MALETYAELIDALKDYTLDPDAPYPTLIRLAETDIAPFVKHYRAEKVAVLPIVNGKVTLPNDFQEGRLVKVDDKVTRQISMAEATLEFDEVGYYQSGNEYYFHAKCEVHTCTITYWSKVPALSPANPTNWILQHFPAVYFHAALIRTYRFKKDDAAENLEKQDLAQAIAALEADNRRAQRVANPIKVGGGQW